MQERAPFVAVSVCELPWVSSLSGVQIHPETRSKFRRLFSIVLCVFYEGLSLKLRFYSRVELFCSIDKNGL